MNSKRQHSYSLRVRKGSQKEKPVLKLTDLNNDCFLNVLSFLDRQSVFNLRRTSKTLKSLCESAIPLLYKKILISGEKITEENGTNYLTKHSSQLLVYVALLKTTIFSRANYLVLEAPGPNLELILCAAKWRCSPEKLKVYIDLFNSDDVDERDKIAALPSIGYHMPYLKKLSLRNIFVTDEELSRVFGSLTSLEAFKGDGVLVAHKERMNCFSTIGPNVKSIKWSDNSYDKWNRNYYFGEKGKQLSCLSLDVWRRKHTKKNPFVNLLIEETPNLSTLHLRSCRPKSLNGLEKLSNLKEFRIDYIDMKPCMFLFMDKIPYLMEQTMHSVKKLVFNGDGYDFRDFLALFPNLEDLRLSNIDRHFTVFDSVTRELEKLTSLRHMTIIISNFDPEDIPNIIEIFEVTRFVPVTQLVLHRDDIVENFKQFEELSNERLTRKLTIIVGDNLRRRNLRETNKICFRFVEDTYKEEERLMKLKHHW